MLGSRLTEEQYDKLFDGALAITKLAWGSCRECKHKVQVEIPDAKAVIGAISDLVTKIADLPSGSVEGERVVFQRLVEFPEGE